MFSISAEQTNCLSGVNAVLIIPNLYLVVLREFVNSIGNYN